MDNIILKLRHRGDDVVTPTSRPEQKALVSMHESNIAGLSPHDHHGVLFTREEWEKVKLAGDLFFASCSDRTIDQLISNETKHPSDYRCSLSAKIRPFAHLSGWTYWMTALNRQGVKIGHTKHTLYARGLQVARKEQDIIAVEGGIWTPHHYILEQRLHKTYADQRLDGEWFDLSPTDFLYIYENAQAELDNMLNMGVIHNG